MKSTGRMLRLKMKTKKKKEGEQKSRREAQYMPLAFRACRSAISIWRAPSLPGLLSSRNIAIQQALFQMVCGTKPASREERRRERWRQRRERRAEQASVFQRFVSMAKSGCWVRNVHLLAALCLSLVLVRLDRLADPKTSRHCDGRCHRP